jgi:hypothetical protein
VAKEEVEGADRCLAKGAKKTMTMLVMLALAVVVVEAVVMQGQRIHPNKNNNINKEVEEMTAAVRAAVEVGVASASEPIHGKKPQRRFV